MIDICKRSKYPILRNETVKSFLFQSKTMEVSMLSSFCNSIILLFAALTVPVKQEGIASYYGYDHMGRKTANGEMFDPHKLTAAHKHLPFNTLVNVKCVESGKSVNVRINDRGPFIKGRIIDLSRAAAKRLGMLEKGIVKCEVRIIR